MNINAATLELIKKGQEEGAITPQEAAQAAFALALLTKFSQTESPDASQLSIRGVEWTTFALGVLNHTEKYTVAQYGDFGEDRATFMPREALIESINKYTGNRAKNNVRGIDEQKRDLEKIAHYACMAYSKLCYPEATPETLSAD